MKNIILSSRKDFSQKSYIIKAKPETNYWFGFEYNVFLNKYKKIYNNDFNIIIAGDENIEGDFYIFPYSDVEHIFNEKYLTPYQTNKRRWVGNIKNNRMQITSCPIKLDCSLYYGNIKIVDNEKLNEDDENDYAINNKIIEIKSRQKQSKFRKDVLDNFDNRCCITNLSESNLLVASHIIPWSHNISTRLDPKNGLCLSIFYDELFDNGYISLDDNLKIIIPSDLSIYSNYLKDELLKIEGISINNTLKYKIKNEYIEYHRNYIYKK